MIDASKYDYIIFDSAIFMNRIPGELFYSSSGKEIQPLMSNNFVAETKAIMPVLPLKQQAILRENMSILGATQCKCNISEKIEYTRSSDSAALILGCSQKAEAENRAVHCLLVTGHQLLIQRILYEEYSADLYIDIYDMMNLELIQSEQFPQLRIQYELPEMEPIILPVVKHLDQMELYRISGEKIKLQKTGMSGTEAEIYDVVGDDSLYAKLYLEDQLTDQKRDSVQLLIGLNLDLPWLALPQEILYSDRQCCRPVGYLERKFDKSRKLDDMPLYFDGDYHESQMTNVNRCLKLIRQVYYLNTYGINVIDFNLNNFGESIAGVKNYLYMWDADSFMTDIFVPSTRANDLRVKSFRNKKEAIEAGQMLLFERIFFLLTLGLSPFYEDPANHTCTYRFNHSSGEYNPHIWRADLMPIPLRILMDKVFRNEFPFSVPILMVKVMQTLERLNETIEAGQMRLSDYEYDNIVDLVLSDEEEDEDIPQQIPDSLEWILENIPIEEPKPYEQRPEPSRPEPKPYERRPEPSRPEPEPYEQRPEPSRPEPEANKQRPELETPNPGSAYSGRREDEEEDDNQFRLICWGGLAAAAVVLLTVFLLLT